jgi:glycosyltransferase involved in cell wall biosynthesis
MYVIAYFHIPNGMASWCWEAAHALKEAGQPVLLVCAPEAKLPADPEVEVLRFSPPSNSKVQGPLSKVTGRLSAESSGFVHHLHQELQALGKTPTAYLLNQSDLQDPRVDTPQYVVGWAYPSSLSGYIKKTVSISGWKLNPASLRTFLDVAGWWRKDWRAYKSSTGVLPVSKRLQQELAAKNVRAHVVHPGTQVALATAAVRNSSVCKLLIVSLNLEERRKRVRFMIESLANLETARPFSLTLVGNASEGFKDWIRSTGIEVNFAGKLDRSQVQLLMQEHDVFLFGSQLDDWGYVLVEAMGQQLCIVAPNHSPFDEIAGPQGVLYQPGSGEDFRNKVAGLIDGDYAARAGGCRARAEALFSRPAFAGQLLSAVQAPAIVSQGRD